MLLDPARLYNYHIPVVQVINALTANNANTGGGFYSQGGQFYYVRGLGLLRNTQDIGDVVVGSQNGVPVRVKDIANVEIGHAPRLGEFGFMKNDDAVEGVILMRTRRANPKCAEGRRERKPRNSTATFSRRTSKFVLTTTVATWCASPPIPWRATFFAAWSLVLLVLVFFLVSFRAAVITALTIPLALLFAFIFLHASGEAANLLSIGAIDFGIIIDGTIVMVENIYRELAERKGQSYDLHDVIIAAARDVDRPIFYSVAVIIAGYLPIYALSGPAGKLFHPMANTMAFALVGALVFTLTLVPVLTSYWFKKGVNETPNKRASIGFSARYATELDWCLGHPKLTMVIATVIFGATLLLIPLDRRRVYAAPR